jgi:NAD(P)-dependent dehydrogenase (short-subunit alcohol dehydrogenase family)
MAKTILVTGATSGIGQETARELAGTGARVIVAGRSEEKARDTVASIRSSTGNEQVDYLLADFASLDQVRGLAEQFSDRYDRLDVLINNAGAVFLRREESADGYEMTFAVNHLAPFLLTNLLLDKLQASAPARIVNVASDSHENATLDLDNLQSDQDFSIMRTYGRSKLANILFTYELARRLDPGRVTANALHPGFVSTGMGSNNVPGWLGGLFKGITSLFARNVAQGAETVVFLADSPLVKGVSGKYFVDEEAVRSSNLSYDQTLARRLWEMSAEMVGLSPTM